MAEMLIDVGGPIRAKPELPLREIEPPDFWAVIGYGRWGWGFLGNRSGRRALTFKTKDRAREWFEKERATTCDATCVRLVHICEAHNGEI